MSDEYPVTIAVRRPDGSTEQVRVGTAVRTADGFALELGHLTIGSQPSSSARAAYGGSQPASSHGAAGGGMAFPNYGRSKGAPVYGASMEDLQYYANGARRSLNDPSKARFHDKERTLLAAIEAEIARQSGQRGDSERDDIPPPSDDDAPF